MLASWLQRQWFAQRRPSPALWLLLPFSGLFGFLALIKRWRIRPQRLPVPVIVVGNITVGGTGKTPLTIWLAQQLLALGWTPGIVSRGYGGNVVQPQAVDVLASASEFGDEPLLLARCSGVPVWVGRQRADTGRALLMANPAVDVILCDDGLQHYRLGRDIELAVFDGRGAGNGWLLPGGPLREPLSRLHAVDAIICNGKVDARIPLEVPSFDMVLRPGNFYRLDDPRQTCCAADLVGQKLHALAGIGDPARFFRTLQGLGLTFEPHPFADHHAYSSADLEFARGGTLLMTEKDAVKCTGLTAGETWVLPVEAVLSPALVELILEKLRGRQAA